MSAVPADRLLITVAPTGAETTKADCPPCRPRARGARRRPRSGCQTAGASMIHVHIRDGEHQPTLDQGLLKEDRGCPEGGRDRHGRPALHGWIRPRPPGRAACVSWTPEPDSCSLTMGTTNFGDDVFLNPWPFVCELYQLSQERGVVPEFELFDLGHVASLHRLLDRYGHPPTAARCTWTSSWASPAGCPGRRTHSSPRSVRCPRETTSWSATGIGRSTLPVMLAALSKGGHLRVGMEDVLTLCQGCSRSCTTTSSSPVPSSWAEWLSECR